MSLIILILIYILKIHSRKMHTLQILSKENRPNIIKLLLTYDYLRKLPYEYGEKYYFSKLDIAFANFTYTIKPNNDKKCNDENYNLDCNININLNKIYKKNMDFDILILQPRGDEIVNINYKYENNKFNKSTILKTLVKKISLSKSKNIWKATIEVPPYCQNIEIMYTLKNVYHNNNQGAIVIAPFNYGKKIHEFFITIDYSHIPKIDKNRPSIISMELFPYNGYESLYKKIYDFKQDKDIWTCKVNSCYTQAIYLTNIHYS